MSLVFQDKTKILVSKIYRLKPFSNTSKLPPDSRYNLIKIHNGYLINKRVTTRDFNELDLIYNYLCVTNGKSI